MRYHSAAVFAVWGVAWLLGFGVLYMSWPGGLGPLWSRSVAGVLAAVLLCAAMAFSLARGFRRGRGVVGPSRSVSMMYGASWLLGLGGVWTIDLTLANDGLPVRLKPLLWSGSSLLVVGVLWLAGGMVWHNRVQYALGVWTLMIGAASVLAGVPANFAVLSLAGGGGLLVAAAVMARVPTPSHSQKRR